MSIETELQNVVGAASALNQTVRGQIDSINATVNSNITKMDQKRAELDTWKANAKADTMKGEARYVQDITIMGSADLLYPVWWRFPDNDFGVGKITISRNYSWNGYSGTAVQELRNVSDAHIASLLLDIEGNDVLWGGDAHVLKTKYFHERYNNTVSHLQFGMYAMRERTNPDSTLPLYGPDGVSYVHSGCYLRGGGLTYRITTNWNADIGHHNGSDPNQKTILHSHDGDATYAATRFVVTQIPFADRIAPVVN